MKELDARVLNLCQIEVPEGASQTSEQKHQQFKRDREPRWDSYEICEEEGVEQEPEVEGQQ